VAAAGAGLAARHLIARHHQLAVQYRLPSGPLPPPPQNPLLTGLGVLFGAWVQPSDYNFTDASQESAISSLEQSIGRKLAIDNLYVPWGAAMPVALARWDMRGGRVPMVSWSAVSSRAVLAGTYDAAIKKAARQLKSLHGPVLLRYYAEMDNGFAGNTVGSPQLYIQAWRHTYQLFQSVGATNVQWVWCPTSVGFVTGKAERFYPGESYVNWIGADGYNWAPTRPGDRWRSFSEIFSGFYQWAAHQDKPLLVAEFGTDEGGPGAKASWFRQAGQQLQQDFPRIKAVVYFNSQHKNFGLMFDWKIDSSPSSLAAFRALVNEPYFSARPST
jgi:Glycosyl hydrolase family 26